MLESEAENSETEPEDDFLLQQLEQFRKNRIDINTVSGEILESIFVLSTLQVNNFVSYRKLFGPIIDIYELQAVPGWDIETIRVIRPYIVVGSPGIGKSFSSRLRPGEHSILSRISLVIERSKGYERDSLRYAGDPFKILLRYKYQFKNLLQYGILAEKDAGESFSAPYSKPGFNFYSFHFFARELGPIKSLAIGDYHVNMGQGLIHWQSLAFRKGTETINIKRQAATLRPYNSTDENRFHRGLGVTIGKRNMDFTFFSAFDQLDANLVQDTISDFDYVSALQNSGYHRTESEIDDKNSFKQLIAGASISWHKSNLQVGVNSIYYWFNFPIKKDDEPYNLYAVSGKSWKNYSINFGWTIRNLHFFGEAASDKNNTIALLNGVLASIHPKIDLAIVYRKIPADFHSLSANAFTDSREPTNEKGLYAGIAIRPTARLSIQLYADQFQVPWLRYGTNRPGNGEGYLIQCSWKPGRNLDLSCRFRVESKTGNSKNEGQNLAEVIKNTSASIRAQLTGRPGPKIILKSRTELVWFRTVGLLSEKGISSFMEIFYDFKRAKRPLTLNGRVQFFETAGYSSRIYSYENDVMYFSSVPALFDKGLRYYVNAKFGINKNLMLWARFAQTVYSDKESIGSGPDEISGNTKSELRLQILLIL